MANVMKKYFKNTKILVSKIQKQINPRTNNSYVLDDFFLRSDLPLI